MGAVFSAWPSSGPLSAKIRGSHVACLVGLNPTMIRFGSWAFDSLSLCQHWKVKCAGAHPRFENEWHPLGCVDRDLPPSAILEREPGRVRGLSGKQTVPLAACDSGSPRSANWVGPRSEVRVSKARK